MRGQIAFAGLWIFALILLVVYVGCGDDPVQPGPVPNITQFSASPSDIMPGDSSLITYAVQNSTRTTLTPDGSNLSPAGSGQIYVKPTVPTTYILRASNEDGRDEASLTITMSGAVATIGLFSLTPDTILISDSMLLSWSSLRADSLVINQGIGRVADPASGTMYVSPTISTMYRAIAFNAVGNDTTDVAARVEVPFAVEADNGAYYLGTMGSGLNPPALQFSVLDASSVPLHKPWIHFMIGAGDGSLEIDSAMPDAVGRVNNDYFFDGQLGYGVVQAFVRDVDTVEVDVRASVIRFGSGGQGQYVRFSDTYADVLALNGTPERVDNDPNFWLNYAVYEVARGVVVAVTDINQDLIIQATEPVNEIFVNTLFSQASPEGVGIGSTISEVRTAYGSNSGFYKDGDWVLAYDALGAMFYCGVNPPDSNVLEIHLGEPVIVGAAARISETPTTTLKGYRRSTR